MKKNKLLSYFLLLSFVTFYISCSQDEECAECHVVSMHDGVEYELLDLGEHCEDALHDLEDGGYMLQETYYLDTDGDSLPSPATPESTNIEVHCGEAHDHDH